MVANLDLFLHNYVLHFLSSNAMTLHMSTKQDFFTQRT